MVEPLLQSRKRSVCAALQVLAYLAEGSAWLKISSQARGRLTDWFWATGSGPGLRERKRSLLGRVFDVAFKLTKHKGAARVRQLFFLREPLTHSHCLACTTNMKKFTSLRSVKKSLSLPKARRAAKGGGRPFERERGRCGPVWRWGACEWYSFLGANSAHPQRRAGRS